ncbi:MAG: HIT domain-containing protein [Calditrichaeota bacterium]|nr:MAG: HIT domain-containing protein [Calditrichota bacterium]
MENLWAPWRIEYILSAKDDTPGRCIFCDLPSQNDDTKNLILYRGENIYVIMNRFPYNNGHLMVVPFHHTGDIQEITSEENLEMMEVVQLCCRALDATMQPHGYNIGMNLGRVSGAGVVDHLHIHIVPRWNGDTNFMPVIGNTKVISEALDKTYQKLLPEFQKK